MFGRPMSEASEQMLMILPRRRAFIPGTTARATRNGPSKLASCSARHSASVYSSKGLRLLTAALLTRMSTGPCVRSISAMPAITAVSSVTSNALTLTA